MSDLPERFVQEQRGQSADAKPLIHVVGIGLDGKAGLSPKIQHQIETATLLVGSDRHLSYFPEHPAQRVVLGNFHDAFETIRDHLVSDGSSLPKANVVVLTSGDPLFFGLGRLLLAEFSPIDLAFYPHLSSVQLAFSRIKVPWHDAHIISAHGRSLDELVQVLQRDVEKIAILTDATNTPQAIARLIEALERPQNYMLWVCENLGSSEECITAYSVSDLAHPSRNLSVAPLNIVIALRGAALEQLNFDHSNRQGLTTDSNAQFYSDLPSNLALQNLPALGIPDSAFASFSDRPGLMTKREIRLLALGELNLKPDQILWDIGAGTGSVSIEAARLCPTSQIFAIEKTAAGIRLIRANAHRFHTANVTAIPGQAPDALASLPRPHSIFVGGSGSHLAKILTCCRETIQPDGTLVLAVATLEHLAIAIHWLQTPEAASQVQSHRLLACQLSRSAPVASLTRLIPLNPVHLLSITFKAENG